MDRQFIEKLETMIKEYKQENIEYTGINRIIFSNHDVYFSERKGNEFSYGSDTDVKIYKYGSKKHSTEQRLDKEYLDKLKFASTVKIINIACTSDMILGESLAIFRDVIKYFTNKKYKIQENQDGTIFGDIVMKNY
jgi:hypothetical protein